MTEQEAIRNFCDCANNDDLQGCLESLKYISIDTLNKQDDDDYDMLITEVVTGNPCAVAALLQDNRCDRTHTENLCGRTAEEFAMDYPEDSLIRQAFANAPVQDFVYRNGEKISKGLICHRIITDTLDVDKGCFDMLDDVERVKLLTCGKISKEEFEQWQGN